MELPAQQAGTVPLRDGDSDPTRRLRHDRVGLRAEDLLPLAIIYEKTPAQLTKQLVALCWPRTPVTDLPVGTYLLISRRGRKMMLIGQPLKIIAWSRLALASRSAGRTAHQRGGGNGISRNVHGPVKPAVIVVDVSGVRGARARALGTPRHPEGEP